MAQQTVSFNFLNSEDFEFRITARVTPSRMAPARGFDRFQEPDDPAEVEVVVVVDEDGHEVSEAIFTDAEMEQIEAKAIEQYDEADEPDFF